MEGETRRAPGAFGPRMGRDRASSWTRATGGYVGVEYEGQHLPEPQGIEATRRLLERRREDLAGGLAAGPEAWPATRCRQRCRRARSRPQRLAAAS
jgi:hypothetical protein